MLRFLRKYSNSAGIKILYAILAALFVVWGVGAVGGERVDVVARVHGEDITRKELDRTTAVLQRRYEEMFKDRFTPELARSLDLRSRALDQLIEQGLIRDEAERLGITVTDNELVDTITRMPELQDNGRFNRDRLESFLREQRDRGEFEDELRRSILAQRLQSLVSDGVQVTDAEVEERYKLDHDQVNLAFVRVAATDLAKSIEQTDGELQKYLDEHPDRYRVPARTRARYVAYKPADFESQVEIKDGEVAEQYELQKDDHFTHPEEVHARHILVKIVMGTASDDEKKQARAKAEDLLAKLKAGADFAALAKKSSDDDGTASKGGDLGFFSHGQMTPEFEAAAFALEPGKLSDVVESPFGYHIIKVEEKHAAGTKSLDEARDEIVAGLKKERALEIAHREAEADRRKVIGAKSFAEALSNRAVQETAPFTAEGRIPGLGHMKDFADAAFALGPGEVSDLIETEDAVYLLTPFEPTEAQAPPLEEVRERVLADARHTRGEVLAKEKAEKILARAKEIGLEQAAAESGVPSVDETGPFDRQGALPKLGAAPDLRTDAFAARPEAPLLPKVYVVVGDGVVASLRARTPADMSGFDAAKDGIRDKLLQQKRTASLTAYMDHLKQRAQREGTLEVRADALGPS